LGLIEPEITPFDIRRSTPKNPNLERNMNQLWICTTNSQMEI